MPLLILECVLIIAYMYHSAAVGLLAWGALCIMQYMEKKDAVDFWIRLIIISIPVSYLEISCEIGTHIFKWYNFAIVGLWSTILLMMIKQRVHIRRRITVLLLSTVFFQLCRNLLLPNLDHAFIELIQEYIIIITVWIFYNYKVSQDKSSTKGMMLTRQCHKWTELYFQIIVASSICVIYQKLVYLYTGNVIGSATIWKTRQVFDMTFTGFSVLSAFLGGGMIIAVQNVLNRDKSFFSLVCFIIIAFACAVNSSRSGFLAAIIVVIMMLVSAVCKFRTMRSALLFGIPLMGGMIFAVAYMIATRGSLQGGNLLFSNGRFGLMKNAMEIMLGNMVYFSFGVGINASSSLGFSAQHNMFLEFWFLNGTLLVIPFIIAILFILYKTRHKTNKYLLWQILISFQFISSFFATTFLPVILILTIGSEEGKRE